MPVKATGRSEGEGLAQVTALCAYLKGESAGIGSSSCPSRPRPERSEELVADQGITTDRDKLNGVGRLTLTRPSRKSIMPGMDKIR